MSAYRVLISCPLILDSIDEYSDEFARYDIEYDVAEVDQHIPESELLDLIDDYHGVLAGDDEFTADVLGSASNLEVISKWGIGTDAIDTDAAERCGVDVYNTPGEFNDEVADVVVGYAIMLTRHLHRIDRAVRDGEWFCPRGTSLAGKTFGVVGVGDIGSTVARRADALGMDIVGTDVRAFPDSLVEETGIERVEPNELFDRADVVSLNCSLTPETREMVGAAELERLGEDGYIINTARGQLIDEAALVTALQDGTVAGAALDVFGTEPLPEDHPFVEMESVILGSHNAQNTVEAVNRVNDQAVENLIQGLVE